MEQSLGFIIMAGGVAAVVTGLALWALVYFPMKAAKATNSAGEAEFGEGVAKIVKAVKITGPAVGLLTFLAGVGAIYQGVKFAYDKSAGYYARSIKMEPPAHESLASVRDLLSDDKRSHVRIILQKEAETFPVEGAFYGECIPDLLQKICGQYSEKLECIQNYDDRSIKIQLKQTAQSD
ncbi:hypothetical protein [Pandoraea terrae]|nr:hypothetical protein [Pandoraea terrae]